MPSTNRALVEAADVAADVALNPEQVCHNGQQGRSDAPCNLEAAVDAPLELEGDH